MNIVFAGLLVIERAHVLTQFLLQDRVVQILTDSLPHYAGSYAPMGLMLTIVISLPLAGVAWALGRNLIRWAPTRARTAIKATMRSVRCFWPA